jgi:tRNA U34 5-carboxymethylaminomethyl modifying GTPase MnmE/TrmE
VLWVVDAGAEAAAAGHEGVSAGMASPGTGAAATPVAHRHASPADPRPSGAWLVRNKTDLLDQNLIRNEDETEISHTNEHEDHLNNSLKNIGNNSLTDSSERDIRFNKPLPNIANRQLPNKSEQEIIVTEDEFNLSVLSGEGFDILLSALQRFAAQFLAGAEQSLVSRVRHREALEATLAALTRAEQVAGTEDLLAEELRTAAYALGRLTGRVDVEDVLDAIFRDFCIGK